MKVLLVLATLALSLVACSPDASEYEHAAAVTAAMAEEGISCDGLETTTEFADQNVVVSEHGECVIEEEAVVISMFDNDKDQEDFVAVGRLLEPLAVGPNWAITAESEATVERIAAALNATVPDPTPPR